MSDTHENLAPTVPLLAAFGLVVITLAGVGWQQMSAYLAPPDASARPPAPAVVTAIELQFLDGEHGEVRVVDAAGELIAEIPAGEGGFLRGVLRGLVRERRLHGSSQLPGFELQRLADGRVALQDMATGRQIDLLAFGERNAGEFLRFLPGREAPSGLSVAQQGD